MPVDAVAFLAPRQGVALVVVVDVDRRHDRECQPAEIVSGEQRRIDVLEPQHRAANAVRIAVQDDRIGARLAHLQGAVVEWIGGAAVVVNDDPVAAVAGLEVGDDVFGGTVAQRVEVERAIFVMPGTAGEGIDKLVVGDVHEKVMALAADDGVGTEAAGQDIVADAAFDQIITVAAVDRIALEEASDDLRAADLECPNARQAEVAAARIELGRVALRKRQVEAVSGDLDERLAGRPIEALEAIDCVKIAVAERLQLELERVRLRACTEPSDVIPGDGDDVGRRSRSRTRPGCCLSRCRRGSAPVDRRVCRRRRARCRA